MSNTNTFQSDVEVPRATEKIIATFDLSSSLMGNSLAPPRLAVHEEATTRGQTHLRADTALEKNIS